MEAKLFEVRDAGTFVVVLAIRLGWSSEALEGQEFLLGRSGFGPTRDDHSRYVLMTDNLAGGSSRMECGPCAWTGPTRTYRVAHDFIRSNWDSLTSGDVVDVQYILRETDAPKKSERTPRKEPA